MPYADHTKGDATVEEQRNSRGCSPTRRQEVGTGAETGRLGVGDRGSAIRFAGASSCRRSPLAGVPETHGLGRLGRAGSFCSSVRCGATVRVRCGTVRDKKYTRQADQVTSENGGQISTQIDIIPS
ncbi:unnamed protein product [Miscanthus lutarioriparius]|uniref:Uncharacterized protein n=1 Tax=Miscanthus lutarioriparius TaxID=422564 RepID=A0A811MCK5_9POAL|nr:unnamed protein product [Miscanthus lutarioriparius]